MSKPLSRRNFILTTAAGALGLSATRLNAGAATAALPAASAQTAEAAAIAQAATDAAELHTLSLSLSETWAKKLLSLQVLDSARPEYGGILCPSYHIVHGRIGDTIYPFLHMARRTGDHRYIDASVLLFRWMESHVSQPDGSWLNEPRDSWKGTTIFATIALCEALRYHGDLLEPAFKKEIQARLQKAGDFIYNTVTIDYGNINYPISASYALSLLGTLEDQPKYKEKARNLAHQALGFFTKNDHFIFGEGTPYYEPSKRGCFSVDLGYNVEESLPSLTLYGILNQDEELLAMVTRSLQTHMEFMLPDGGWDNSWGTRNYKWTWWGSRTSDGCQPAYALLANRDSRFTRVALKNTQLFERCTIDGILYGGPHYASHHIPPSIHHTFTHIKALTTILDHQPEAGATPSNAAPGSGATPANVAPGVSRPAVAAASAKTATAALLLPREAPHSPRFFPDIQTWLLSTGGYRATITAYDREYKAMHNGHATGGALSLLWHEQTGPIFVASMTAYQLVEAGNMQKDTDPHSMSLTPRMEYTTDGVTYTNIADLESKVTVEEKHDRTIVRTESRLVDKDQHEPAQGTIRCQITYTFTPKNIRLSFHHNSTPQASDIRIVLPVISASGESFTTQGDKTIHIKKQNATLTIRANQPLQQLPTTDGRIFNFVPGFEAIPLAIQPAQAAPPTPVKPPTIIDITIH
ncbi:MAG: hypothetical protein JST68_12525 [Bacteroidetes bacterium]|nr:hypothetical protein [Bacteroidota bacterium]